MRLTVTTLAAACILSLGAGQPAAAQITFGITDVLSSGCGPLYTHPVAGQLCAYTAFDWDAGSASTCQQEDLGVLDDCAGVTATSDDYRLAAFAQYPDGTGDHRIYAGGVIEVREDAALRLRLTGCRFTNDLRYGPPPAIAGSGWCTIDAGSSDAGWVAEFDNGTGQARVNYASFSDDVQGNVGYFDFTAEIVPAPHIEIIEIRQLAVLAKTFVGEALDFADADVDMLFASATRGGGADNTSTVYVNRIGTSPGGDPPSGLAQVLGDLYWEIGTTLDAFTADVNFDVSDFQGIVDPSKLRILHRERSTDAWAVYGDQTLVNSTTLRANGVTAFSEWAIGAEAGALPVELVAFDALAEGADVVLTWRTAGETNNAGFHVETRHEETRHGETRHGASLREGGWQSAAFVAGRGTTAEAQRYTHRLAGLAPGRYAFRLRQVDYDGTASYSPEVEVTVAVPGRFDLAPAYPNPFNPQTRFSLAVAQEQQVVIELFDALGRRVRHLFAGRLPADERRSFTIDAETLSGGLYFIRVRGEHFTGTQVVSLLK